MFYPARDRGTHDRLANKRQAERRRNKPEPPPPCGCMRELSEFVPQASGRAHIEKWADFLRVTCSKGKACVLHRPTDSIIDRAIKEARGEQ